MEMAVPLESMQEQKDLIGIPRNANPGQKRELEQHDETLEHQLVVDSHHELLGSILGSKDATKEVVFYSYTRSINGFPTRLEEQHTHALSELTQVLSVFLNQGRTLHTTTSWGFLGLDENVGGDSKTEKKNTLLSLQRKSDFGKEIIVANIDTRVWPESESFNDVGMGPVPSRWKGIYQTGTNFNATQCNRKLIGARYFIKGYEVANGPFSCLSF
jgi:hypothetical protein